jgi:hypothetical protein
MADERLDFGDISLPVVRHACVPPGSMYVMNPAALSGQFGDEWGEDILLVLEPGREITPAIKEAARRGVLEIKNLGAPRG